MLDQLVGGILGGLRNTVIVYCLIGAMMLCTQRWGSRRPSLAIQYQTSKAAMWLMTHNLISPEPYPHAFVLRGILGYETGIHEASNDALITLRAHPMTEFLRADETLHAHIWNKNWRQLHSHSALLSLTTNPEFLYYAKIISTPQNTATEEEPTDRFQELR